MANKANKDGVDFQHQLYYYVIGLVHGKYDYSILYEGDDKIYAALDDVILRIHTKSEKLGGLYFIQAKQTRDESITLSIQDMLHYKVNVKKYIDSYCTYSKSNAYKSDGEPTEMIYWTTNGLHNSTMEFMAEHTGAEPHLTLTIDTIKKYSIKHWKALFMFDTAQRLASHCLGKKIVEASEKDRKTKYLPDSIVQSFAHEILEPVNETVQLEQNAQSNYVNVKFREQFLDNDMNLSDNAKHFRYSFAIACTMQYNKPDTTYDLHQLKSVTFCTDLFQKQNPKDISGQCKFEFAGLSEDKLNWFFNHFIFYIKVPKNDAMVEAIGKLFNNQWNTTMFEKYLVNEPLRLAQAKKDKKNPPKDCFLPAPFIASVLKMIELKSKLVVISPKGIDFKKERSEKLCTNIEAKFNQSINELTILSKPKEEWTAARILQARKKTLVVCNVKDYDYLLETLQKAKSIEFGTDLISGEVQYILLLHLPNIAEKSKKIVELLRDVKVITMVGENDKINTMNASSITDHIVPDDVIVNYEQLELKRVIFDAKPMLFSNCIRKESIDSSEKLLELCTLRDIDVKSDLYESNEQNYIERKLLKIIDGKATKEGDGKSVTHSELLINSPHAVSVICDKAGQGKSTELLRIAKIAQDIEGKICLYIRAKTIAKYFMEAGQSLSTLEGLQLLQKLLYVKDQSAFIDDIVNQCLSTAEVCILVDGFDEMIEEYQKDAVKFLLKVFNQSPSCSLVIATRDDSVPVLKKEFKHASYYKLAPFSYKTYFEQLWLNNDSDEISPILQQNVNIFLTKFDLLQKSEGCTTFLEVPQLCKIMATIYQDRIREPNIQWHTNYKIGSIYDTFVQSQYEHTLRGKFDEMDKLHLWAKQLIEREFYEKHSDLACELENNSCINLEFYEQLTRFGLIMIQKDASKSVEFLHRTVMEYFLVRKCLLDDVEEDVFFNFVKRYFCVSRANIADKFIDFFVSDKKYVSSDKKRIISSYLYTGSNVLATCIRMALNNATFNTLKLLLSVAPKQLLGNVCFRFGGTNNPQNEKNEINLKRLGENQMILLLETLKECDDEFADDYDDVGDDDNDDNSGAEKDDSDDRSILQRMLFETNPTEEDTLEVAIRKPFLDVFDWFKEYCTQHFSSQIQSYLTKRIPRYAQTIIRHCYAENKEKIIDRISKLCAETLDQNFVRKCLQSFDLMGELILNIENVPQGKQFKEVDRLDLVQKIVSLLDLYLDNESLRSTKEQSRQRVEQLQNEAIKLYIKQWINT